MSYQEMLLNVVVNELTSHGAMLFAVLSSSFVFLRIINDYYKNQCYKINCFNNFILLMISSILFGISIYVFIKIIYWGRILHFTINISQTPQHDFFINYTRLVISKAVTSLRDSPLEKVFIYPILPKGGFPNIKVILLDWLIGGIISFTLMSALGGMSRKYIINCIMNFLRDSRKRIDC